MFILYNYQIRTVGHFMKIRSEVDKIRLFRELYLILQKVQTTTITNIDNMGNWLHWVSKHDIHMNKVMQRFDSVRSFDNSKNSVKKQRFTLV